MSECFINLFDTHCHMDMLKVDSDLENEFSIAKNAGVDNFLVPGCGVFNWDKVEEISQQEMGAYYSLGFHPLYLDQYNESDLLLLDEKLAERGNKCVAIGECGLDFYVSREDQSIQLTVFIEQIKLANHYQLPLIIHSRKAHQDVIKSLKQNKVRYGGVIHAFTGSIQQAMDYIDLGFYIGVGGTITYPRAQKTRNTISHLPLESLVLETDTPDMPVLGEQGVQNHPRNLPAILNELISLRSESKQTIAQQVLQNSKSIYSICE